MLRKAILFFACVIISLLLFIGVYLLSLRLTGNVHTVIPQQVIRTAQLSPQHFVQVIQDDHIRTVLDLAPTHSYHQEARWAAQHHVTYDYLPLKAKGRCPILKLKALTHLVLTAQRPLLIHCKSGSDRTGLASAIVLIDNNASLHQIKNQIAYVRYGILSPYSIGRVTLAPYFLWLTQHNLHSSRKNYNRWLDQLPVSDQKN